MPFIAVNGIRMYYEMQGQGPPIFFIHGLGSCAQDWRLQAEFFKETNTVIAIDLRGHGQSEKPRGRYSIVQFAEDCACCIEQLKLEPVYIVGLSLGCYIGIQLAISRPDLIKGLIGVNGGVPITSSSLKTTLKGLSRIFTVIFCGTKVMGKKIAANVFPRPDQDQIRDELIFRIGQNPRRPYLSSLLSLMGWDMTSKFGEIQCPVLLISSDKDYTPVEAKRALLSFLKEGSLHIIEDARHVVNVEKPEEFNNIVAEYIRLH